MKPPRLHYKFEGRYVKTPQKRNVQVELWTGKRKKILGKARNVKDAEKLQRTYVINKAGLPMQEVRTRKKKWDHAAIDLAKRAIKSGLRKGDTYEIWTGKSKSEVHNTDGGSSMRTIASRRKGSKSLAEEITREMFRLAKLRLKTSKLTYQKFIGFDLPSFHLRIVRRKKRGESPRSIPKTTAKGKRSLVASRNGKTKRKRK